MTKEDIELYQKVFSQINGLYKEIGLLSKKNPNDVVNDFKIRFINKNLKDANSLLGEDKPYTDFDFFEDDSVPTTSDVVMMLEQYISALRRLKARNTTIKKVEDSLWESGVQQNVWIVNGKASDIHA